MMAHSPGIGLKFDPAQAKRDLRDSGVDSTGQLKLDLVLPNWDKPLLLAEYIQEQLKKNLGLTVNLQTFDHKTFRSQLELFAFPLFLSTWSADYPDPDDFLSVYLSDSGNNRAGWKNAQFDKLVLEARYSRNLKQRERDYIEAQKILLEQDAAIVPLFYEPNIALIRGRVKGLELNPLNYLLLRNVHLE
jgi:oligopeptide transport system substrate-binding protein